jgi:hypothetical protein
MIKQTIRRYCYWCSGNQSGEIKMCSAVDCSLYSLRTGKNLYKLKRLKAIASHCTDCRGGSQKEVKECDNEECPLYPYRKGKNPLRKGVGNKDIQKYSGFKKKLLSNAINTKEEPPE